ncbi:tetratricopeptide repeat protein [Dactylosporangium sp. NPDC051541]|uniref:tetratricopeptide repeat protein n=1 Tax=Dactylosporangium sp. NPDC051541 TaxID=3363977 RepID=UPI0037971226
MTQHVTADGGFAYGAVGADIHVFGDGTPVYLLERWSRPPGGDPGWLLELPSRLLNARFEVVEFTGRHEELAALSRWRDGPARLAAHWLHGPGGAGKTRLAAQFAAASAEAGWKVITAVHGPGSVLPPPGSQDLRLDGAAGVLLIVDYADRWPHSHLTWLFSNTILHRVGVPARILLLGRTADAWPALRGALANLQSGTSSSPVQPLGDDDGTRLEMFSAARDAFSRRYGLDPADVDRPDALRDQEMGLTLALHMAALVAVDAHAHQRRPPTDMAGLTVYLLDREHRHWADLYGDPAHDLDDQRRARVPPRVMHQMVFTAALTGTASRAAGTAVLERIGLPADPGLALDDHAACYPPAAAGAVLEPLYPDRLAEDFLALTMPGHPADYPAQSWAPATTEALVGGDAGPGRLSRAITFLAAAADRWPHLGPTCLFPLLTRSPQLAVEAGGAALTALAAIRDVDFDVLAAVEPFLPPGRHADLDVGVADLVTRLAGHRLATATDPAVQAHLHANVSWRLDGAGRVEDALASAQQAYDLRRALVAADRAAHLRDLAVSAHNLAACLGATGRLEETVGLMEESVELFGELTGTDPAGFLPRLAEALASLAANLQRLGRGEEAYTHAERGTAIRRRLADEDPARHLSSLATALADDGVHLAGLGRPEESLAVAEEAVALHRQLAEQNPAANLPGLAIAAHYLGNRYGDLERWADGRAAAEESVRAFRRLAEANPDRHRGNLAGALDSLSLHLSELQLPEDALDLELEAIQIRRQRAAELPAVFRPELARSLQHLAGHLAALDRGEEALAVIAESVSTFRELAAARPAAHLGDLAEALDTLASCRSDVGLVAEAVAAGEEAVAIHRRLGARPALADLLRWLGGRLGKSGRLEDGLAACHEAVEIHRQLARAEPAAYRPELAKSLRSVSLRLGDLERWDAALAVHREAVAIWRRLAASDPDRLPALADALCHHVTVAGLGGRMRIASAAAREAAQLYEQLGVRFPGEFTEKIREAREMHAELAAMTS